MYQVLYDRPTVERNKVHLFIAWGVHAEVKLGKRVDWSTVVERSNKIKVPQPANGFFPMDARRYPEGELGYFQTIVEAPHYNYVMEDSSTDNDFDGTHMPPRPSTTRNQQRIRRRRALQIDEDNQNGPSPIPHEPVVEAHEEEALVPMQEEIVVEVDTIESLKKELNNKINKLQGLYEDSHRLRVELQEKNNTITRQSEEIGHLRRRLELTTRTNDGASTVVEA